MKTDFKTIDKTAFKCHQMPDGSFYYGQVVHVDPENDEQIEITEDLEEEIKNRIVMVRHGYGIQIYGKDEATGIVSKYAGQWDRDSKHGDGHCVYKTGCEYRGNFVYNEFHGMGEFKWKRTEIENAYHTYRGEWNKGKMEGEGEFSHSSGHSSKPIFKNNMCNYDDRLYFSPFMEMNEIEAVIKRIGLREIEIAKDQQKENEKVILHRVDTRADFHEALKRVRDSHRTPLILSAFENPIDTKELASLVELSDSPLPQQVYLRTLGQDSNVCQKAKEFNVSYKQSLSAPKNWSLVLNFDEDEENVQNWQQLYDPDTNILFGKEGLNQQNWQGHKVVSSLEHAPQEILQQCEAFAQEQKLLLEEEAKRHAEEQELEYEPIEVNLDELRQAQLSMIRMTNMFQFTILSKTKFKQSLSDEEILAAFHKRFAHNLPLQYIDCVYVTDLKEKLAANESKILSNAEGQENEAE